MKPKIISHSLFFFFMLLMLGACRKQEETHGMFVSEREIVASYQAGEVSFPIYPWGEWTATVAFQNGLEEQWIQTPVTAGTSDAHEFVFRVTENPSVSRQAKISFILDGGQAISSVIIRQESKEEWDVTDLLDLEFAAYWMSHNPTWGRITYQDLVNCRQFFFDPLSPTMSLDCLSLMENLSSIIVRNTELYSVSFGRIAKLENLLIENSSFRDLDLSGLTGLKILSFKDTSLPLLDTRNNPGMETISFEGSYKNPDVERVLLGPGTEYFSASNAHQLRVLDCTNATSLKYLFFPNCDVHSLDLSVTQLKDLQIRFNPIDELVLPQTLESLSLTQSTGSISYLKFGPKLQWATIWGVPITELDLKEAVSLTHLDCCDLSLPYLDVSHISLPEDLRFAGNPGESGLFRLIVSPQDYLHARELYEGREWNIYLDDYNYRTIVVRVVSSESENE